MIKIDSSLKMQFNTNKKGSLMSLSIFLLLAEEKKLVKSFRLKKSDQSGTSSKSKNNIVEKIVNI